MTENEAGLLQSAKEALLALIVEAAEGHKGEVADQAANAYVALTSVQTEAPARSQIRVGG